jgi:hypothetical protein
MIKKDRWGFTLANFDSMVHIGLESFAFLLHIEQVMNRLRTSVILYPILTT